MANKVRKRKMDVALELIEIHKGSVCIGLRYGKSPFVRIIRSLEDMYPDAAVFFIECVLRGDIPMQEVCAMRTRLVELPVKQ